MAVNVVTDSINDKTYQISLDVVMAGVSEERRKAAEEIIDLFHHSVVTLSDYYAAEAIIKAYQVYDTVYPDNLFVKERSASLVSLIYAGGYIAGIRHERQRRKGRRAAK